MNAMIFAAGLGTRLQPLTNDKPKALVEFKGKPLLWYAMQNVINAGAERVVVNVHHFAQQVIEYINSNQWNAEVLISNESDLLLDTGGGLVKAKSRFIPNKPIIIQNADILISTNVKKCISSHLNSGNDATLMVKNRNTSRYLLFNNDYRLIGWENVNSNEIIKVNEESIHHKLGFCGVHVVQPSLIEEMGESRPFSIIKAYLNLADRYKIAGYQIADSDKWFDVGTVDKLNEAKLNY